MRFVHYIKRFVDLDYQTYISNLNITINEKMKEFSPSKRSRIFYGFDEIYSITYFSESLGMQTMVNVVIPQKRTLGEIGVNGTIKSEAYKSVYLMPV